VSSIFDEEFVRGNLNAGNLSVAEKYLKDYIAEHETFNARPYYYLAIVMNALNNETETITALNNAISR